MQGRPPLCLNCTGIGHTRKDCLYGRSSYVKTVRPNGASRSPVFQQTESNEKSSVSQAGPSRPDVPPMAADSVPAPACWGLRTLKFGIRVGKVEEPTRKRVFTSVGELINVISAAGVRPEDFTGVYKLFDSSF